MPKGKIKYVYRKAKGYASKRYHGAGGFKGSFKTMIIPAGAGILDSYLDPMLPIDGVGAIIAGFFGKNAVIRDIGLYKAGMSAGNILPLPFKTGSTTQGGLL